MTVIFFFFKGEREGTSRIYFKGNKAFSNKRIL
jgi:hypothetical protein